MLRVVIIASLLLTHIGCTHHQLRFNAVHHAGTVADVHTQQVLNNLAKFVHDEHALPHFSYPNQGLASVTDNANGGTDFDFNPYSSGFNLGGSRQNQESYTMVPVNDPEKLELLRCLFQRAASGCLCSSASTQCPDCDKRFNQFYFGSTSPDKVGQQTYDGNASYRVKKGRFVAISNDNQAFLLDQNQDYDVVQRRNEKNEVVFKITGNDALEGWGVFKLRGIQVASKDKLDSILKENRPFVFEKPLSGYANGSPSETYRQLLTDKRVFEYKNRLYRIPSKKSQRNPAATKGYFDEAEVEIETNEADMEPEAYLGELDAEEKKGLLIDLEVPVGIASSSDLERHYSEDSLNSLANRSGSINPSCLSGDCWFKTGTRWQVPKTMWNGYVGHHRGTYVWVPKCGRDQLTKVTLSTLNIVFNDSPSSSQTEVYALVGKDGKSPATINDASYLAKADLARGSSFSGLLPSGTTTASPPENTETDILESRVEQLRLDFKRLLVKEANVDIYKFISSNADESVFKSSSVRYLSTDYRERSLSVRDGDFLIPLAAHLFQTDGVGLALSNNEELEKALKKKTEKLGNEELEKALKGEATDPRKSDVDNYVQVRISKLPKEIVLAARRFLDAEYQIQNTTGVVAAEDGDPVSKPTSSTKILFENQSLRPLEAIQSLRAFGL